MAEGKEERNAPETHRISSALLFGCIYCVFSPCRRRRLCRRKTNTWVELQYPRVDHDPGQGGDEDRRPGFFDGIPTEEIAALLYDNLDFLRGVETFLNGMPATLLEALRHGEAALGVRNSNQILIFDQLMDSNPLFLTGNTDTVYLSVFLDLKKDGPTVVDIPAGAAPGTVNDIFFRFVIDMGPPGPDKSEGGKYPTLPPDYEGDVPDGYFIPTEAWYDKTWRPGEIELVE